MINEKVNFVFDYPGNMENKNGYSVGSLYNYFFNPSEFVGSTDDYFKKYMLIPPVSSVISLTWTPYISRSDLSLYTVQFDLEKFTNNEQLPKDYLGNESVGVGSILYRINSFYTNVKSLGSLTCYRPTLSIGGSRSWKNESKLYNFPYSYGMLFDGVGSPFEFKYHECASNINNVKVRIANTNLGSYNLFIEGYKGDTSGTIEGHINNRPPQLPVVSNAYMDYMAQSSAQLNASLNSNNNNMIGSVVSGVVGGAITGATVGSVGGLTAIPGALVGALVGGVGAGFGSAINNHNAKQEALALEKDLRKSPNVVTNMGSDTVFNFFNSNGYLTHYHMKLKDEYMERIGDYFAMYGYKQNRLMIPNYKSRYYYNYVKTVDVNVKSKPRVSKAHVEEFKSIFNNGVTVWHITNTGVTVGDYSKDNKEV